MFILLINDKGNIAMSKMTKQVTDLIADFFNHLEKKW